MLGFNEGREAGNKVRVVYRDEKQVCCASALSTWWSTKLSFSLHCCSSHNIATVLLACGLKPSPSEYVLLLLNSTHLWLDYGSFI